MNGLFQNGLKPCISENIWGENSVSLLAVMVHWIDGSRQLMKRLGICEPYGKVSHTGEKILQTTKRPTERFPTQVSIFCKRQSADLLE
jgi:hypothetical protein